MAVAGASALDLPLINLSRLLSCLSRIILTPGPELELLRRSHLERRRVGANLDYARTLLLQLEQQSFTIKAQNRKHALQVDLADRKDLIARLNEQLYHFNEIGDEDDEPGNSDGEDLLDDEHLDSTRRQTASGTDMVPNGLNAPLDRRKPFAADEGHVNGAATSSDISDLFHGSPRYDVTIETDAGTSTAIEHDPRVEQTEKVLSFNRSEQEDLTASLLSMAQALKVSSEQFATSLDSEKDVLSRASEGLDKNSSGMQAAEKRMTTLRRMTEGRGWLGRMLMYACIAGLWMMALVIVGFLPKLRF